LNLYHSGQKSFFLAGYSGAQKIHRATQKLRKFRKIGESRTSRSE
jgi:hypothetical protein